MVPQMSYVWSCLLVVGTVCLGVSQARRRSSRWQDGDIRLIGGSRRYMGTILVYHDNKWGAICDDLWGMNDAHVACRQLGYTFALKAATRSEFGPGRRRMWINQVRCRGTEQRLDQCTFQGYDKYIRYRCPGFFRSAGVICSAATPTTKAIVKPKTTTATTTAAATTTTTTTTSTTAKPPTTTTATTTTDKPTTTSTTTTTTSTSPSTSTSTSTAKAKPTRRTAFSIMLPNEVRTSSDDEKQLDLNGDDDNEILISEDSVVPSRAERPTLVEEKNVNDITEELNGDHVVYNAIEKTSERTTDGAGLTSTAETNSEQEEESEEEDEDEDEEEESTKLTKNEIQDVLNDEARIESNDILKVSTEEEEKEEEEEEEEEVSVEEEEVEMSNSTMSDVNVENKTREADGEAGISSVAPEEDEADEDTEESKVSAAEKEEEVSVNEIEEDGLDSQEPSMNPEIMKNDSPLQVEDYDPPTFEEKEEKAEKEPKVAYFADEPPYQNIEVDLAGGRYVHEGHLRIRIGNEVEWGAVCSDHWTLRESLVVCTMLGSFGKAKQALKSSYFGGENLRKTFYQIECVGTEQRLDRCTMVRSEEADRPCSKSSAVAGVVCSNHLPDLIPNIKALELSVRLQDQPLYYLTCSMEENCLANSAYVLKETSRLWRNNMRRLLRFSTVVHNRGNADFRPYLPRGNWEWHACHMHYHSMEVFAHYDIMDAAGNRLAEGSKASFCLEDTVCDNGITPTYNCQGYGEQGLSVNCSDNYMHDIDCQWIDITDIKPGDYTFLIEVNPQLLVAESNFDNNVVSCHLHYNGYYASLKNCHFESLLEYRRPIKIT